MPCRVSEALRPEVPPFPAQARTLPCTAPAVAGLARAQRLPPTTSALLRKTRADELVAVSEAVKVLTDDDARDTFTSTFNFLQLRAVSAATERQAAAALLQQTGNPQMQLLASSVAAGIQPMERVKAAIVRCRKLE